MTRNLKTLGLALVAAFALSAVLASAASAEFTTSTDNTTLTAEALNVQEFAIEGTPGENAVSECNQVSVDGTAGTASTEITVEPTYSGCTLHDEHTGLNPVARINTNGCHYLFTTHENESVHIVCPAEAEGIEIEAKILGAFRRCLVVHPQTPTNNVVHWINGTDPETGAMDVELESTITGITWEKVGLCAGPNTVVEGNDASYKGNVTVTGDDEFGAPADVTVNH